MKAQFTMAAGLLFAAPTFSQSTIASGTGFGTYYYDIEQVQACSDDFGPQNQGPVECSSSTALSLDQLDSNYLVAMNHTQLIGDIGTYCGKRVVVSVNGVPSSLPLFIGDGCQRCGTGSSTSDVWDPNGAPGLDFSYSVLSQLSASACADGHISISWEIVDDTLYNFDTNAPDSPQGPVGGSDSGSPTITAPASTSEEPVQNSSPTNNGPTPTTLATVVATVVVSSDPTVSSPTSNDASGPCPTGAWQCNLNNLEQCLEGIWTTRATCAEGLTCQGGNSPYCAPAASN